MYVCMYRHEPNYSSWSGEHDDRFVEDLGLLVEIVEEADLLVRSFK